MRLSVRLVLGGSALLWLVALAAAQDPKGGPTCQERLKQIETQIGTQYERVLKDRLLLPYEPSLTDPAAQAIHLSSQLRIVTQQFINTSETARRAEARIATLEVANGEQDAIIKALRAELASLKVAPTSIETPAPAPSVMPEKE